MLSQGKKLQSMTKLLGGLHQREFDKQQYRGNFDGAKVQQKVKWTLYQKFSSDAHSPEAPITIKYGHQAKHPGY